MLYLCQRVAVFSHSVTPVIACCANYICSIVCSFHDLSLLNALKWSDSELIRPNLLTIIVENTENWLFLTLVYSNCWYIPRTRWCSFYLDKTIIIIHRNVNVILPLHKHRFEYSKFGIWFQTQMINSFFYDWLIIIDNNLPIKKCFTRSCLRSTTAV